MEQVWLSLTKDELENTIIRCVNACLKNSNSSNSTIELQSGASALDQFLPIELIFKRKLLSPPTFYEQVKAGKIALHKVGRKSFIRASDYEKLFRKVEILAA